MAAAFHIPYTIRRNTINIANSKQIVQKDEEKNINKFFIPPLNFDPIITYISNSIHGRIFYNHSLVLLQHY